MVFLPGKFHGQEPGGLQSMGLDAKSWTRLSTHTHYINLRCTENDLTYILQNDNHSNVIQHPWSHRDNKQEKKGEMCFFCVMRTSKT